MTTAGSISSSTTGSTLDVPTLVSQLMTVARQPIDKLNTKTTSYQAQISELGTLKSKMAAFQTAAQALGSSSSSSLLAATATSSDTTALSATADSTSVAGTYTLNVAKLAQAQSLVAAGQASSSATIGDGTSTTITFDFGTTTGSSFVTNGSGTKSVTINSSNNTLQGIRDAINAAGIGVTASIVNDGSTGPPPTPYRLVLTSSSGASNSMKITTDGANSSVDNLLAYDPAGTNSMAQIVAPQDAVFDVNGLTITKSSNTVTDAISGVTLTLSNPTTKAVTLTVGHDTSTVASAVASFVTAYNDLYTSMKTDSAWGTASTSTSSTTSTTTKPPILAGDLTLRSLQTQMRDIASTAASGGTYSYLFDAGVSFKTDGTMQLDSAKLNSALSTNFSDVANLFNSSTGFGTRFNQFAASALTVGGSFDIHTADINSKISDINNQVATLETRMTALQAQYTSQYSALDMLLTSMNSTSNYLTSQFNAMASQK